jgi:hypothetical protein
MNKVKVDRYYKSRIGMKYGPMLKKGKNFTDKTYGYIWNEKGKLIASPLFTFPKDEEHDNDLVKIVRRKSEPKRRKPKSLK